MWTANLLGGSVTELSNAGSILSGDNGYGFNDGTWILPDAIAIDAPAMSGSETSEAPAHWLHH